ncbi:hypothetical protein CSKR_114160 [Clonorchis sinensis]|uniref:Uncharacterized protein n=1 Tax=Clonorchis sinensis TaxID=79923 RepID=A0A419PCX5_CLOSI|nr:hypothetical protein CSKR_114160 [Clonorchis sinensis]
MVIFGVKVDLFKLRRRDREQPTDVLSWHVNTLLIGQGRTCITIVEFWITGPASPDLCKTALSMKLPGIWIEECEQNLYGELLFGQERLKTYGLLMNQTARKQSVLEVVHALNNGKARCTYNGLLTAQYE